jgi:4-oxalocrotonate tautomerase
MPLVRISLLRGKPPAYRKAIRDGIYRAMIDTFDCRRTIDS